MYLTPEEESILDGEKGEFLSKCMRVLVRLGEALNAERLIPITRAHLSGISITTAGKELALLLDEAIKEGVKVKVKTTTNPCAVDFDKWRELGLKEEFVNQQKKVLKKLKAVGAELSLSCTPYYSDNVPKQGEIVAFAESSAVIYVNSVIGARTLRHGSIDALAAAFIGKVPFAETLIDDYREPKVYVELKDELKTVTEYGLLGFLLGELISEVAIIRFKRKPKHYELKHMGAAMATSGKHAIYHVVEVTPGWKKWEKKIALMEKIIIDKKDLLEIAERFEIIENPKAIVIGCPHVHPDELKNLHTKNAWIFCAKNMINTVKNIAKDCKILTSTCPVTMPLYELGIDEVVTNSVKAAWYIPKLSGGKTRSGLIFI